ncbi:MAG TPA: type II toxin-antitoxin system HicB family antitoxin [Pseudolabrys sp.]|nr:type II toxin-antitoxin system HicB family antitoxin [Pseudolabrys sp.]
MIAYKIILESDTNGTLLVSCPDLPGVNTFGEDRDDAVHHAVDAIETWIASLMADGLDVPRPKKVRNLSRNEALVPLPALTTLKLELYWALRESDITRAELTRRLKWNRESVDRLFRLDHQSRIDQIERAFGAMNKRIDLRVLEPMH